MQIGNNPAKPKALIARARTMVWTLMINLVVAMQRLRGLARRSSALEHSWPVDCCTRSRQQLSRVSDAGPLSELTTRAKAQRPAFESRQ
jgi:hypothetical protein